MRLFLFSLLICYRGFAQTDSAQVAQVAFGLKVHSGAVLVHTQAIKNVEGSKPYGIEVEYSRQGTSDSVWNRWGSYPRSGIALSYFNFNNKILGSAVVASLFIEPHLRLANRVQIILRGAAGLLYATNPYHPLKNIENNNYPNHINPYLQIGGGINYQLTRHLTVAAMQSLQHFSNGGFKQPNRGLNWLTTSVGLLYYPNTNSLPHYKRTYNKFWKHQPIIKDAGIMFVPQQGYSSRTNAQRQFLIGAFVQLTKQLGRFSGVTAGVEVYNSHLKENPPTETNLAASNWFAGVHAGHAFLMNRVTFKQQIGIYLFDQTSYFAQYYYRFGLDYRLSKHFLIGLNLKSHTDNADFLDGRLMYRF